MGKQRGTVVVVVLFSLVLALLPPAGRAADRDAAGELRLYENLPKDPIWVFATNAAELDQTFAALLDMVQRTGEEATEKVSEGLQQLDKELGISLRGDFLTQLGPEVAVAIDVPPIDMLAGMAAAGNLQAIAEQFIGVGLVARVRDAKKIEKSLEILFQRLDGTVTRNGELLTVDFVKPGAAPSSKEGQSLRLHYGIRGGVLALGLSPRWVTDSFAVRPEGERLFDGADCRRVFAQLDKQPRTMYYFNLPRAQQIIRSSQILGGFLATDPNARRMADLFLSPEYIGVGYGSSSIAKDGGVRTTTFGPEVLNGGVAMTGIIAAIAVPNLLNAIQRGKQKRTMSELRTVGSSIEEYSVDNGHYPACPSNGWVAVDTLAAHLQPTYVKTLPTADAWSNPLKYWCKGETYRVVSAGKDGTLERDWSGSLETTTTQEFVKDIVFGDGLFLVSPEGTQN